MKPRGDVPQEHLDLAAALEHEEKNVDLDIYCPPERKAQGYTCLAHDWFDISMEEEGNRLLLKAENTCPGYFKNVIGLHMKENPNFDILVKRISLELLHLMLSSKV